MPIQREIINYDQGGYRYERPNQPSFNPDQFFNTRVRQILDCLSDQKQHSGFLNELFPKLTKLNIRDTLRKLDTNAYRLAFYDVVGNQSEIVDLIDIATQEGYLKMKRRNGSIEELPLNRIFIYKLSDQSNNPALQAKQAQQQAKQIAEDTEREKTQLQTDLEEIKEQLKKLDDKTKAEIEALRKEVNVQTNLIEDLKKQLQTAVGEAQSAKAEAHNETQRADTAEKYLYEANQRAEKAEQALGKLKEELKNPEELRKLFTELINERIYTEKEKNQEVVDAVKTAKTSWEDKRKVEVDSLKSQIENLKEISQPQPETLSVSQEDGTRETTTKIETKENEAIKEIAREGKNIETSPQVEGSATISDKPDDLRDTSTLVFKNVPIEGGENIVLQDEDNMIQYSLSNQEILTKIGMNNEQWLIATNVFNKKMDKSPLESGLNVDEASVALTTVNKLLDPQNNIDLSKLPYSKEKIKEYQAKLEAFLMIERNLIELAKAVLGSQFDATESLVSKNALLMAYYSLPESDTSDFANKVKSVISKLKFILDGNDLPEVNDDFILYIMKEYKQIIDKEGILKAMEK